MAAVWRPPSLERLLAQAMAHEDRPAAFVLAGHNGSPQEARHIPHQRKRLDKSLV